jgi:hypothetical protein
VLLLLAAALNAGAGIALGIALTPDDPPDSAAPAPAKPTTISAGDLSLTLPRSWRRLTTVPVVAGFSAEALAARGPRADVVATVLPPQGPTLLPSALVDEVGGILPHADTVEVAGRAALRYAGLSNGRMDIYAVPTTAGVVSIACLAPRSAALLHGCDAALDGVGLGHAAPVAPDERAAFAIGLPTVVAGLNRARADGRRALARQTTPRGRAQVSRRLGGAYRDAARVLSPLAGDDPDTTGIVRQLDRLAAEHRALAVASFRRLPGAAGRAGARIRASEQRLADELGKWTGPSDGA